jgi:hypothetical protein
MSEEIKALLTAFGGEKNETNIIFDIISSYTFDSRIDSGFSRAI